MNSFNTIMIYFTEIPALGDTNSHRYLIETSKEYIGFEDNNKIIESLRKEITQLRRDLLTISNRKKQKLYQVLI